MENMGEVLQVYFHNVSAYNILCGKINYEFVDELEFKRLMFAEFPNISESEIVEMYSYLCLYKDRNSGENGLNVFRALKEIVDKLLDIRENLPICHYDKLLIWRKLLRYIGEDLLVCAFLAKEREKTGRIWESFTWNPVIGHDNVQFNRMLQRGLSDNHFHLFGSAPSFKLIWIRLMNDFLSEKYLIALQKIETDRRQVGKTYSKLYEEESLVQQRFKAGVIRAYLFSYIDKIMKGVLVERQEYEKQEEIQKVLESKYNFFEYYAKLAGYIEGIKLVNLERYQDYIEDYACEMSGLQNNFNAEFAGERKLMYQMLCGKIGEVVIPSRLMNWFYAYLVIQMRFRGELVQLNDNVGFANFSQYNGRKSLFLDKILDEERMIRHAVGGSVKMGNIRSLELRIKPENTAVKNKQYIEKLDSLIERNLGTEVLNVTYYVFHFPKKKEEELPAEYMGYLDKCRNYKVRYAVENSAKQILEFREYYPEVAARVLGIDACAQELYCRPEVFGPVFRMLSRHVVHNSYGANISQLKITYHVGEDWYDIVDGLRAIDEAIMFLGVRNGDRLGHATVLGIDVWDWYEKKNATIWISLQNYLDNIVWLYHKLVDFDIRDCESLKGFLLGEYDRCFRKLYKDTIEKGFSLYTIDTYYRSWKLRGDCPTLYINGKYEKPYFVGLEYKANGYLKNGDDYRKQKELVQLIYDYHYSAAIRRKGIISCSEKVSDIYIKGVEMVQKAMQIYVSELGIGIETNPSSNYKISTIDKYEKHPILNFYNMGLTWDEDRLRECPQLHVSINTDDKGVFDTSLENEYSLMGCAVENIQDNNGRHIYQKQMVYDWLERIRQNGNQQSFFDRNTR